MSRTPALSFTECPPQDCVLRTNQSTTLKNRIRAVVVDHACVYLSCTIHMSPLPNVVNKNHESPPERRHTDKKCVSRSRFHGSSLRKLFSTGRKTWVFERCRQGQPDLFQFAGIISSGTCGSPRSPRAYGPRATPHSIGSR